MSSTTVSSKGQVIIPKPIRDAKHLRRGQRLQVLSVPEGVLLKPMPDVPETTLDDVIGILQWDGPAVTIDEMDAAVAAGIREQWEQSGS